MVRVRRNLCSVRVAGFVQELHTISVKLSIQGSNCAIRTDSLSTSAHLQDELDGVALYRGLADAETNPKIAEVHRWLADVEQRHADEVGASDSTLRCNTGSLSTLLAHADTDLAGKALWRFDCAAQYCLAGAD